jgi:hypothetical protein
MKLTLFLFLNVISSLAAAVADTEVGRLRNYTQAIIV